MPGDFGYGHLNQLANFKVNSYLYRARHTAKTESVWKVIYSFSSSFFIDLSFFYFLQWYFRKNLHNTC